MGGERELKSEEGGLFTRGLNPSAPSLCGRGTFTPNKKVACFVFYLKFINTLKNNNASYSKLSKELKK